MMRVKITVGNNFENYKSAIIVSVIPNEGCENFDDIQQYNCCAEVPFMQINDYHFSSIERCINLCLELYEKSLKDNSEK
jgi:hypothetical protein